MIRKCSKKPAKPRKKQDIDVETFGEGGGFGDEGDDYNEGSGDRQ